MRQRILFLMFFLGLAACSQSGGKTEFNPQEVGRDIDSYPFPQEPAPPDQEPTPPAPPEDQTDNPPAAFPEDPQMYNEAWKRLDSAIVLDCYQGNSINWDKVSTDKRVVGVIHRASIGLNSDLKFHERRAIAEKKSYLWGAYHLGKSGDPISQAKLFLKTIENSKNTLMVLDLEDLSDSRFMTLDEARQFIEYVREQTGRIPIVYTNHSSTKKMTTLLSEDPLFRQTRLWYARYRRDIPDFPKGLWSGYFLWQFSSHLNCSTTGKCLYNVPGTDRYIDVNVFYGSQEALRYQWLQ